jgi:hypothetical protein
LNSDSAALSRSWIWTPASQPLGSRWSGGQHPDRGA